MTDTKKSTIEQIVAQLMTCFKHDRKIFTNLKNYNVRREIRKNLKQYNRRDNCR